MFVCGVILNLWYLAHTKIYQYWQVIEFEEKILSKPGFEEKNILFSIYVWSVWIYAVNFSENRLLYDYGIQINS